MQCQMRTRKPAERDDNNQGTLGAQFATLSLVKPIFESPSIDITVVTLSFKLHQPTSIIFWFLQLFLRSLHLDNFVGFLLCYYCTFVCVCMAFH